MGGADTLKTEGLVLQGVCVSHMRTGCKLELPVVSICAVRIEADKAMCIIRPGSHKATQAKRFWSQAWENIKGVGWNNIGEFRDNSRGRWGRIPGVRGRVSRGRKGRGRLRT